MPEVLESKVSLTNQKVQFKGVVRQNPAITIDYTPPVGDGDGYTSLELLLVSLSTCVGTSLTTFLRRMKRSVSGLEIHANGIRRDQHPTYFESIALQLTIVSVDATREDVDKVLRLSEETYCPVWAMIKHTVKVTTEYEIRPQ